MEIKEAIQLLKHHNLWRRYNGDIKESQEMVDPKKLGIAIDTVVSDFENLLISVDFGVIQAALDLAFEAGKWEGQVELEEFFDRNQFAEAILEAAYSRKNAMPLKDSSTERTVTVNLRSDKWREGVRKSARKYVDKAMAFVVAHYR